MGKKNTWSKTLVILILLFNGTVVHERLSLPSLIHLLPTIALAWGCHRKSPLIEVNMPRLLKDGSGLNQGWYLNDGARHCTRVFTVNKPIECLKGIRIG